jgi:hypothetical protein
MVTVDHEFYRFVLSSGLFLLASYDLTITQHISPLHFPTLPLLGQSTRLLWAMGSLVALLKNLWLYFHSLCLKSIVKSTMSVHTLALMCSPRVYVICTRYILPSILCCVFEFSFIFHTISLLLINWALHMIAISKLCMKSLKELIWHSDIVPGGNSKMSVYPTFTRPLKSHLSSSHFLHVWMATIHWNSWIALSDQEACKQMIVFQLHYHG